MQIWDVKSERGFTFLELIMVVVVTGILSSALVIPFISGIKQGTRPEIYATATYIAQKKIEELRSGGYASASGSLGTSTTYTITGDGTPNQRTYTETVLTEYVEHDSVNEEFDTSASSTEFIRVTVTVSNSVTSDVSLWTILTKDFF